MSKETGSVFIATWIRSARKGRPETNAWPGWFFRCQKKSFPFQPIRPKTCFFLFFFRCFLKKKTSKNPTSFWTPNVQVSLSSQRLFSFALAGWLRWILASRCHIAWAFASWMMKVVSLRSPGVGEDLTLEGIWPTIEVEETNGFCGKSEGNPFFSRSSFAFF